MYVFMKMLALFMKLSSHSSSTSCSTTTILFQLLFGFLLLCTGDAVVKLPENLTIPAVIAFGDSIVDQGNNNNIQTLVKADFPPYGKDFEGGIPTGRFCNGKTPADLIVEELGIGGILPAYLDPNLKIEALAAGVSFASGGSGYDPQTPKLVSVISLSDQLKMFKEYIGKLKVAVGEEKSNYILANSLHVVVVGSDDIANTYFTIGIRKFHNNVDSYTDLMLTQASNFIKEIYQLGARRMAVFGAPPVGCLPAQRTLAGGLLRTCKEEYNQAAQLFNTKLSGALGSLQSSLAQSRVVYIDIYNPLLDIIQNPHNYGFDVVDKGCCGTGNVEVAVLCNKISNTCPNDSVYLFWDSYHPTEKGYRVLVDQILQKHINSFL